MPKPTQEELLTYFSYNSLSGHLTWIKKAGNSTILKSRAGSTTKTGYRRLTFRGKNYQEHHIIWCIVHGQFPTHQIDHEDQVRDNNAISNLKEVTQAENARNRSRRTTSIDEAGIWYCKRRRRYIAELTYEGKKVYQATFIDIDEAIKQRAIKLTQYGFHTNHGSAPKNKQENL